MRRARSYAKASRLSNKSSTCSRPNCRNKSASKVVTRETQAGHPSLQSPPITQPDAANYSVHRAAVREPWSWSTPHSLSQEKLTPSSWTSRFRPAESYSRRTNRFRPRWSRRRRRKISEMLRQTSLENWCRSRGMTMRSRSLICALRCMISLRSFLTKLVIKKSCTCVCHLLIQDVAGSKKSFHRLCKPSTTIRLRV